MAMVQTLGSSETRSVTSLGGNTAICLSKAVHQRVSARSGDCALDCATNHGYLEPTNRFFQTCRQKTVSWNAASEVTGQALLCE